MDKRVTFHKLQEMMGKVNVDEISLSELRKFIIMNVGSSERTIYSCLRILLEMGMIRDIGNTKFKVLHDK